LEATASKKGSGKKGVRYTPKEKAKILEFVANYDKENGRGGQSAAAAKYGISTLTLINWKKEGGEGASPKPKAEKTKPSKKGRKSKKGKSAKKPGKRGRRPGSKRGRAKAGSGLAATVTKYLKQIESNEKEIAKLTGDNESLKQKLKAAIS